MIVAENGGGFTPIDEGTYTGICVRVIDQGTQPSGQFAPRRKVLLSWEIPEIERETENGPMPALVSSSYTASLSEKSKLRPLLETWRGRKFTPEELRGFDLKNVLGAACLLNVVHSADGQYANVAGAMALPKGMPRPTSNKHQLINFDLDHFDQDAWDSLSPKMQEKIAVSPEYKAARGGLVVTDGGAPRESFPADLDDEIPF